MKKQDNINNPPSRQNHFFEVIITGVLAFLIGYMASLTKWATSLFLVYVLILLISIIIFFVRRIIVNKSATRFLNLSIIDILFFGLGFILGIGGLKIQYEFGTPLVFSIILIYSAYMMIRLLRDEVKYKLRNVGSKLLGYLAGIFWILIGSFLLWGGIVNFLKESSVSLISITGLILAFLGLVTLYYSLRIKGKLL